MHKLSYTYHMQTTEMFGMVVVEKFCMRCCGQIPTILGSSAAGLQS